MAYYPATPFVPQFFTDAGVPLAGGTITAYLAGTTTPTNMFIDDAGTSAGSVITLNARGEPQVSGNTVVIWLDDAVSYKFVLKDASSVSKWTIDDIGSAASISEELAAGRVGRVVDSIAALKALDKTEVTRAFVTGYYAAGDGGGGNYWYDSTDTTSTDNGGTIIVASDSGRWKLIRTNAVSVKQFGAVGDGVIDDATAIQAAVTAGNVFFPAGDYLISEAILVPSDRHIHGQGYSSRIVLDANANPVNLDWMGGNQWFIFLNENAVNDAGDSGIDIHDLYLDFSNKTTVGHCIHMRKCHKVNIHHNYFNGGNDATAMTACYDYVVSNNVAWGQTNCCYDQWDGCHDGVVSDNIGRANQQYGILVTGNSTLEAANVSYKIAVTGNIIIGPNNGSGSAGIWLQGGINHTTNGVQHCIVSGNYVYGFNVGIKTTGAKYNALNGNVVEACVNAGLQFGFETAGNESQYNSATGNVLNDCASGGTAYPIEFQANVSNNTVTGGVIAPHGGDYAVGFFSGAAANLVTFVKMSSGSLGRYTDAGANNLLVGQNGTVMYTSGTTIALDNGAGTLIRMGYGSAAPTTGAWLSGEMIFNSSPAVGSPKGWVCTVAGSPGVWVSMGNL